MSSASNFLITYCYQDFITYCYQYHNHNHNQYHNKVSRIIQKLKQRNTTSTFWHVLIQPFCRIVGTILSAKNVWHSPACASDRDTRVDISSNGISSPLSSLFRNISHFAISLWAEARNSMEISLADANCGFTCKYSKHSCSPFLFAKVRSSPKMSASEMKDDFVCWSLWGNWNSMSWGIEIGEHLPLGWGIEIGIPIGEFLIKISFFDEFDNLTLPL